MRLSRSSKASINQDDIENSLACLPVYLAGCRQLLILAGPTCESASTRTLVYPCMSLTALQPSLSLRTPLGVTDTERLWCIVEVFTFLRMGSSPDNMVVKPLAGTRSCYSLLVTHVLPGFFLPLVTSPSSSSSP